MSTHDDKPRIYTSQLSGEAHFALNMVLAMDAAVPDSIIAGTDPLPASAACPGCKARNKLRKIRDRNVMICLACFQDHKVSDFLKVFRAAFGQDFKDCPREKWLPILDAGLQELSDSGVIELTKDGMAGWAVKKINLDRLEVGIIMVN